MHLNVEKSKNCWHTALTKSSMRERCRWKKFQDFRESWQRLSLKNLDNFFTSTDFWEEEEESCRPSSEVCCNYSEREPNVVFEGDVVPWLSISWRSSIVSRSRGRTSLLGRLRWTLWTSAVYQGQYGQGQLSLPSLRGRHMSTSFGCEGKGRYGSFR